VSVLRKNLGSEPETLRPDAEPNLCQVRASNTERLLGERVPEPNPEKGNKMATAEVLPIDKPANWAGPDSYMISTEDL